MSCHEVAEPNPNIVHSPVSIIKQVDKPVLYKQRRIVPIWVFKLWIAALYRVFHIAPEPQLHITAPDTTKVDIVPIANILTFMMSWPQVLTECLGIFLAKATLPRLARGN